MTVYEWAQSVKADLVALQARTGIPALWAAAQMAHESAVGGGQGLSELATRCQNYAGLKWASWQSSYGCTPAKFGTWEEIGGVATAVEDAFCSCPSWEVWLQVYAGLLTGNLYGPALAYKQDPLLYGFHVWQNGWATDSRYIVGVAKWMTALFDLYADTLPTRTVEAPAPTPVVILNAEGKELAQGWLDGSRTVVPLRAIAEGLGKQVEWNPDGPKVTIR